MKKEAREALEAYYEEAGSWAEDQAAGLRRSRRIAWIVAIAAMTVAVAEAFALMMLAPLKTAVPYTLLVDRATGYVQALKPLEPGEITPDKALVQSMMVQYVIARESFDRATLQNDYRKVGLWSAEQARTDYASQMSASNPDSSLNQYPPGVVVVTRVKSVSPLSDQSALVRFETFRRDAGGPARAAAPWVAVVQYRFVGEPMSVEDRFLNPLGFQVVSYRRDPEAAARPDADAAPAAQADTDLPPAPPGEGEDVQ